MIYFYVRLLGIITIFVMCFAGVPQMTENKSQKLFKHLFRDRDYSPSILPLCDGVDKVTVRLDLAVRELVELTEKYQLIRLKIWVRLKWTDCTLQWNASEFDNIESLIVPHNTIWIPDITLYESSSDEANMPGKTEYSASISHVGQVMYNYPTIITSACRIDVTMFPYDYQNCSLKFGSWIYDGNLVDLIFAKNPYADMAAFVPHNEWDLVSVNAVRHVQYYQCCPLPYPDITYFVHLARYPKFHLLTVFIPCVIISILSLMGFVLPPISGDKISIQITVLLAIVVFLLLVQDKLPSSSETFPHLGVYFMIAMCLVSLSCVMSGIIMYIYYRDTTEREVPQCVRRLLLGGLRRVMCVKLLTEEEKDEVFGGVVIQNIQTLDGESLPNGDCAKLHKGRKSVRRDSKVVTSKCDIPTLQEVNDTNTHVPFQNLTKHFVTNEWELLAYVLDRLFMIIYMVLTLINIISFLCLMRNELHRF